MGNASSSSSSQKAAHPALNKASPSRRFSKRTSHVSAAKAARVFRRNSVQKNQQQEEQEESPQDKVERLETNVATLRSKCARLEAQNILVSVQQLDILARSIAGTLAVVSYFFYLKVLLYVMSHMPSLINYSSMMQVTIPSTLWWLLGIALACLPYLHNKMNFGCTYRRFEVFAVAFIIIARMKLARWRERMFVMTTEQDANGIPPYGHDCTEEAIWDANYDISARFLYVSILRLCGLWTKTAQYLSARADFMPPSYVRELRKLQDEAPATPWEQIRLPRKIQNQLVNIDTTPIASASIGQVHVAQLKATGEKVALKVQHPSASTLFLDDFWSLRVIARFVVWMDPEYGFFEILMNEWAKEARHELEFKTEAKNLESAYESIQEMFRKSDICYTNKTATNPVPIPFQVEIPRPIMNLTSRRCLVMTFSEGFRVDDFDKMDQHGLSRDAVMDGVAQTFAHMMYASNIFNGDPHSGNLLLRPGTKMNKNQGFTLVLLDWGLAKRLPDQKRLAFCQMAYAAATMDFGLLLDAFKTIGLRMKRENVGEDMEGMRFFLRDIAPPKQARKRIKAKIKTDIARTKAKKNGEKVPMESKAYPGEFFFFVRVNELIHGLGAKFEIEMSYLDVLKPYAERGLQLMVGSEPAKARSIPPTIVPKDTILNQKIAKVIRELDREGKIGGVQVCVLDKNRNYLAHITAGTLGGLKKHIPMQSDALILGFSCTKAVTATIAHIMVKEGYLDYDEPVCQRIWPSFCPSKDIPEDLATILGLTEEEGQKRWSWKRQITLRHILTHQAGLWATTPHTMTIKSMASCEKCVEAYEFNPDAPEATILPTRCPGEESEYHFMSFGWLVAGTLIGAYSLKTGKASVTFEEVYNAILLPKLSAETLKLGFRPCGGPGGFPMAQTVTTDVKASEIIQKRREAEAMGEVDEGGGDTATSQLMEQFRGKEFLLDARIWNCQEALDANVPAAGGRFTANGLAHFYHDLANKILDGKTFDMVSQVTAKESVARALQGATVMRSDTDENRTTFGMGYQLISFDKDSTPSGVGHAGVGGSIGLFHKGSGLSIAMMTNKADGGSEMTMRISRVIMDHLGL